MGKLNTWIDHGVNVVVGGSGLFLAGGLLTLNTGILFKQIPIVGLWDTMLYDAGVALRMQPVYLGVGLVIAGFLVYAGFIRTYVMKK